MSQKPDWAVSHSRPDPQGPDEGPQRRRGEGEETLNTHAVCDELAVELGEVFGREGFGQAYDSEGSVSTRVCEIHCQIDICRHSQEYLRYDDQAV